jgi:hypothetical protein
MAALKRGQRRDFVVRPSSENPGPVQKTGIAYSVASLTLAHTLVLPGYGPLQMNSNARIPPDAPPKAS